jgi:hypothetical protein
MKVERRKFFPKYSTVPYQFRATVGDIVYCTDKERSGCIVIEKTLHTDKSSTKKVGVVIFEEKGYYPVFPLKKIHFYKDSDINKLTCLVKVRPETLHREFTYNNEKEEGKDEEKE